MPKVPANGIELEMESFGAADATPLILIMGIGAQMILWPDEFCSRLAARGFQVIRFDNRDVGLSTWLDHEPKPNPVSVLPRALFGLPINAPYRLEDMAQDTVGLLDALQIDRAHIVGISMGGMIAQTMALSHPERMRSMVSLMSHPGNRRYWRSRPRAISALMQPVPNDREAYAASVVRFFRTVSGPRHAFDEAEILQRAGRAFDRGYHPAGFIRHFAAVFASGGRLSRLRTVTVPTLVLHGTHDPLIIPAAGRATARAIPGAHLMMLEGLGHHLPEGAWPQVIDAITDHAERC